MAEWRPLDVPDATPKIASTLAGLGSGLHNGQIGLVRLGSGADTHEEEFVWYSASGQWIGREHVALTTTDGWALDLSRCPIANFDNAWARFSGGVGWEVQRPRSALRSAVSLPQATINIHDVLTPPLAASGQVLIRDQLVSYTGWVSTASAQQLTGCTGGTGSFPADYTPVIPWTTAGSGGGDPGGWGTNPVPLDRVDELWDGGFRLEERVNAWINGSVDLKAMQVAPFYFNSDLGEDLGAEANFPTPNAAPETGMLGPGLTLTGPAYDLGGYTVPGNHDRRSERGFEESFVSWTAWSAAAPTKRFLTPVLYGKMAAGADDNGEVYGLTLRLRWIGEP